MISSRRTYALLVLALALPFGLFLLWAHLELGPQLEARAARQLERTARLIGDDLRDQPFADSVAERAGAVAGLRVTLIGRDGTVLGDSEVDPRRLARVENHADRPEVATALSGEVGADVRASGTVSLRLLYVAVPHEQGAVRVAIPIREVREFLVRARQVAAATALLALALATLLTGFVHRYRTGPIERLRAMIRAIGEGDLSRRTGLSGSGALASLGHSVDEMAMRLEDRLRAIDADRGDLAMVFDRLDDGLAVVGPDGHIRRVNRSFETWIGRTGLEGQRVVGLFRDPRNRLAVDKALSGEAARHESELGPRTIQLSALPLASGCGALVVIRDLTRTRQLEGVRRDFVANVSHELKTPLTGMRGFAEALAEGGAPPEQASEFAGRILANVERMQRLVDDLLDLARIESGSWRPEPAEQDLAALVEDAWASIQPGPGARDVTLDANFPPDLGLQADGAALAQVLCNLLDNAARYSPDGGSVRLTARREDGRVRVEIADDGPGIPSIHVERVFERFYRVDAARSREAGGTGLGLSIVKHLVAAHGGEVGIRSRLGEGTTVWFAIPDPAAGPAGESGPGAI
jgi:two-component system, OmpR family, phosphate regulon sensor histidine kinase PhoR